jgi:hypothetical protein
MQAPDPRQLRRSQADFPLIGLSEFGRPPLFKRAGWNDTYLASLIALF